MLTIKNYLKKSFISVSIIFCALNQIAFSQSIDDSRRAIKQSNDMQSVSAELRMCQNACMANFRNNAFSQPSNANQIVNQCQTECQENYQTKMSCIQSPSSCNSFFGRGTSSNSSYSDNSTNILSNIFWFLLIIFGALFILKKKDPEKFNLIYSKFLEKKEKITNSTKYKESTSNIRPKLFENQTKVFWIVTFLLLLIAYIRLDSSDADAFIILPLVILIGTTIAIIIQSIFFRQNPFIKLPMPFIYSAISFIFGAVSFFSTLLMIFLVKTLFGNGYLFSRELASPFIAFVICFLILFFNTLQIKYYSKIIKSIPDKFLYAGIAIISIVFIFQVDKDYTYIAVLSSLAYISSVYLYKLSIIDSLYNKINSVIKFEVFVNFILRISKFQNPTNDFEKM